MAIADRYNGMSADLHSPYVGGAAVTPNDSADLAELTRAVWVGGTGDLKVTFQDGSTVVLQTVPAGSLLPIRVSRIFASGTTATLIAAIY